MVVFAKHQRKGFYYNENVSFENFKVTVTTIYMAQKKKKKTTGLHKKNLNFCYIDVVKMRKSKGLQKKKSKKAKYKQKIHTTQ